MQPIYEAIDEVIVRYLDNEYSIDQIIKAMKAEIQNLENMRPKGEVYGHNDQPGETDP